MTFLQIPLRVNGNKITYSWFDSLRAAGLRIEQALGYGITGESQQTIADNQSAYANVTNLTLDGSLYIAAEIRYTIYRTDGITERRESGSLWIEFLNATSTWRIADRRGSTDALNVTDSLGVTTTLGVAQIQYKSDNMGSTIGKMRWKIINTMGIET